MTSWPAVSGGVRQERSKLSVWSAQRLNDLTVGRDNRNRFIVSALNCATVAEDVEWRRLGLAAFRPLGKRLFTSAQISDRNAASFASAPRERAAARLPNSYQRASDWLLQGYAAGMSDDPPRPKPEPPPKSGSVVSIADRNQELRHEAARRLAERHNASLRPLPDATA